MVKITLHLKNGDKSNILTFERAEPLKTIDDINESAQQYFDR